MYPVDERHPRMIHEDKAECRRATYCDREASALHPGESLTYGLMPGVHTCRQTVLEMVTDGS